MKDFLSAKGIEFTEKNIGLDNAAREELVTKHGKMAAPTLVVGDKVFLGFRENRAEIEGALKGLAGD